MLEGIWSNVHVLAPNFCFAVFKASDFGGIIDGAKIKCWKEKTFEDKTVDIGVIIGNLYAV